MNLKQRNLSDQATQLGHSSRRLSFTPTSAICIKPESW